MADTASLIEALQARADALSGLGHRIRFDLTDVKDSILLDATGATADISAGPGEAEAVLTLSTDTLDKLITGRIGPMMAFSTGRLRVEGSQGVALKLAGLLDG
ncbi:SCP2 sterol-binding domain-containing protein [Aquabacter spiritensis]|uniref:SCP-2 sterol transfer family protein n=1 Tax=Aquabacter spiritensis TaxID=933073 RepID=A0A4R3LXU6_9HYPH|nr:SCP2 sterol-binding domain-containing protein [Aquabacter spiritensis]TCT03477.1 SCP-2 sterol transfer family protein [Aquabacter spiritensis]